MSPDVYAAFRTAGAWLAGHWTGLGAAGLAVTVLTVLVWAWWPRDDYRSRNDRRQAAWATAREPRPEPAEPGTDIGLYPDCVAIYSDCEELDRLRDAINQHRTGEK
ncbi:hypothetical protein ACIP8U_00630 [Streptomyces pseudovenezuelae]|uniref:hypothetical protein n=1 Tax=Streptomyces pseudovenezuelae TaxID=67350 RepID=UPI0037F8A027